MDQIGYNYETGDITNAGKRLINCLKDEVFPLLSKKYNASSFVSYIGHSYAASYGNYLFLNEPTLFNSYILIAPEKLKSNQPKFILSTNNIRFYNENTRSYYLATGENDIERRIDYAKEITAKVRVLDTSSFNFKYLNFKETDHNTLFASALPNALAFLYAPYNRILQTDGELSAYDNLIAIEDKLNKYYGINLERSFKNYNTFLNHATSKNDTISLVAIVKHFENQQNTGQDIRNFAYFFRVNGLTSLAYSYYQKAINTVEEKEFNTKAGHRTLVTCYRELALNFYQNNQDKSWELLQKALNDQYINYPEMKYDLGEFSVVHNYKLNEGLKYLLSFANDRKDMVDIINVSFRNINLLIAKAYFLQKDKAKGKQYAQLVLNDDPKNKEAIALLGK